MALLGNALAVVHGADALDSTSMQVFAAWTNLSETTFLLEPRDPAADYRVRIFTPTGELPFAGHPTLGSCHAWLERGGVPTGASRVVQECEVGLIPIRRQADGVAFAAPPLRIEGVASATLDALLPALGLHAGDVREARWLDNRPSLARPDVESVPASRSMHPMVMTFVEDKSSPSTCAWIEIRMSCPES